MNIVANELGKDTLHPEERIGIQDHLMQVKRQRRRDRGFPVSPDAFLGITMRMIMRTGNPSIDR